MASVHAIISFLFEAQHEFKGDKEILFTGKVYFNFDAANGKTRASKVNSSHE